jgi:hypothetical protein
MKSQHPVAVAARAWLAQAEVGFRLHGEPLSSIIGGDRGELVLEDGKEPVFKPAPNVVARVRRILALFDGPEPPK